MGSSNTKVVPPPPPPTLPPRPAPAPADSLTTTCYGANSGVCNTCNDVVNAYKANKWRYNTRDFAQCKTPDANTSCYGARNVNDCYTCQDVIDAYSANKWNYNIADFAQCSKPSQVTRVPQTTTLAPTLAPIQPMEPVVTTLAPSVVTQIPIRPIVHVTELPTTAGPMINPRFDNLECPGGTQLIGNLCVGVPKIRK